MKKSLIAVAALAATGAFAQSSVTLFGLADIAYGSHKTTGPNAAKIQSRGVMDGANAGSRIGFRGVEDLGGGLRAEFLIEQGISPTNDEMFGVRSGAAGHQVDGFSSAGGAAALSGAAGAYVQGTNRQTYLGLSGGFGSVRIGYQYTNVYELATLSGYAMGSEGVQGADKAHLHGFASAGGTRANAITYISPRFGGLQVRAQYGSGGAGRELYDASAANAASGLNIDKNIRTSVMAKYDQGPLSAAVALTTNKVSQSARAAGFVGIGAYGASLPATATAITNTAERTGKLWQLGASYDLGMAKVGLTYNNGENGGAAAAADNTEFRAYNLSATVPLGAAVPFVSIGKAKSTNQATRAVTEDYSLQQFGVRYSLSKRTTGYLMVGTTKNDVAGAAWAKDSKTVVGVAHSF